MKILSKILMALAVLYFSAIVIGFIMGPEWGVAAITLPLTPFIMLDTYFSLNSKKTEKLRYSFLKSKEITREAQVKASQAICSLKHLKESQNNNVSLRKAKQFCNLSNKYKVYFFEDCDGCDLAPKGYLVTGYVLVKNEKPIESIMIDSQESEDIVKNKKSYTKLIPILKQLH